MFRSGLTSGSEVAPDGALHGEFSADLVGLDMAMISLSSSELLSSSTGSCTA